MKAKISLLEMLIIGLLCGVVGAYLGNVFKGIHGERPVDRMALLHSQLVSALETYRSDNGVYPSAEQGLAILLGTNGGRAYLKGELKDPWGRPISYFLEQGKPVIGFSAERPER